MRAPHYLQTKLYDGQSKPINELRPTLAVCRTATLKRKEVECGFSRADVLLLLLLLLLLAITASASAIAAPTPFLRSEAVTLSLKP